MATGSREILVGYSDGVAGVNRLIAAPNESSPANIETVNLVLGANTITVPPGTVTSATIVPPPGNTQTITLKGVTGDTGVALHRTDPTSLGLNGVSSFVLTAGGTITGLRIFWT